MRPHPRPHPHPWWRRAAAAAATIAVLGTVAACGSGTRSAGETAASTGGGMAEPAVGAPDPAIGGARDGSVARLPAADGAVMPARAVIRTGEVSLTSPDLDAARADVDRVLADLGGAVESERTSHDDDGTIDSSTLVVRVPVARFADAMSALQRIGKTRSSDQTSDDVSTEMIDVDERVETLRNSLDRLQSYQAQAADIEDLLRFEQQITEREAQLQSLRAQQAYLVDQAASATITVTLTAPPQIVGPPDALGDAGLVAGLRGGWNALTGATIVALTVVGAALPFAAAAALIGAPGWWLLRRRGRRRDDPSAAAAAAP